MVWMAHRPPTHGRRRVGDAEVLAGRTTHAPTIGRGLSCEERQRLRPLACIVCSGARGGAEGGDEGRSSGIRGGLIPRRRLR